LTAKPSSSIPPAKAAGADPFQNKSTTPAPEPEGFIASNRVGGEPVWIVGSVYQIAESGAVVGVTFKTKDGEDFKAKFRNPAWNCDPASFKVGDKIAVRGQLHKRLTRRGEDLVVVGGHGFYPAL
jgi:hypothetical protein